MNDGAPNPPYLAGDSANAEQTWLQQTPMPGMAVEGSVSQRRRIAELNQHARMTIVALAHTQDKQLVAAYLREPPTADSVSFSETTRFCEFVRTRAASTLVRSVARFERGIADATAERTAGRDNVENARSVLRAAIDHDALVELHPWRVVALPARAEDVIVWIAFGSGLPALGRCPVVIGPGLPGLWREAWRPEELLCSWWVRPRTLSEVERVLPGFQPVAIRLIKAGVLRLARRTRPDE